MSAGGDSFTKEDDERSFGDNLSSNSDLGENINMVRDKTYINRAMDNVIRAVADPDDDIEEEDTFDMEGNIIDPALTQVVDEIMKYLLAKTFLFSVQIMLSFSDAVLPECSFHLRNGLKTSIPVRSLGQVNPCFRIAYVSSSLDEK